MKIAKIILIAAVFAFFSAGFSMAQDWKGGHQNSLEARGYSHYQQGKSHKFQHNRQFKNYHRHKRFSKYYRYKRCRLVVQKHRHHHYRHYRNYRSHTGAALNLSVFDPNVAFSVGVTGH